MIVKYTEVINTQTHLVKINIKGILVLNADNKDIFTLLISKSELYFATIYLHYNTDL